MAQRMINHIVQPDGTTLEIHDYARGQPNGVATLSAQGKLIQSLASVYATDLPSPNGIDNLAVWADKQFTVQGE